MLAVQTHHYSSSQLQRQKMTLIDLDQWMEDFADFLADVSKGTSATGMSEDIYRNLMQYCHRPDVIKRLRKELLTLELRARILSTTSGHGGGNNQIWMAQLQIQLDEEQQNKRQLVAQHARDLQHFQFASNRESEEYQHLVIKVKQLKSQTKAQNVQIQSLEQAKADLQSDHALLLVKLDQAQAEARKGTNSDVLRVQANYIKDLERVRDTKLQELEDLDQRMLKERKDYRDLLNDRNALQDQKEELESAYRDVVSKHTSLRSRNQELEGRIKAFDSKPYRELANEHQNFRNLNQELGAQIKATRKANRKMTAEYKALRSHSAELEAAVKNGQKAQRDVLVEHDRVRARNAELEASLSERQEAYNVLGSHSEGLQRTVDSLKNRRERLEQEYEDLSADRETLAAQVRGLEKEKKVLEGTTMRLKGLAKQIQDASGDAADPLLSLRQEGLGGVGSGGYEHPTLLPIRLSASHGHLDSGRSYVLTAPLMAGVSKSDRGDKKAPAASIKSGRSRSSKTGTVASSSSKVSKGSWTR